jgi:hypothetical protein
MSDLTRPDDLAGGHDEGHDEDHDGAPAGDRDSDGTGPARWPLVAAIAAAIVLGVLAAALAVLAARDDVASDTPARHTAGRFAEALLTVDHTDPEAGRDAVLELATGGFRAEYDEAFSQGIAELIVQTGASARAVAKDVFLSEIDGGSTEAVVVLDVERDGAAGPRTVRDLYLQLSLVRVDGTWLVSDVTDLNLGARVAPPAGDPGPFGPEEPPDAEPVPEEPDGPVP